MMIYIIDNESLHSYEQSRLAIVKKIKDCIVDRIRAFRSSVTFCAIGAALREPVSIYPVGLRQIARSAAAANDAGASAAKSGAERRDRRQSSEGNACGKGSKLNSEGANAPLLDPF